MTEEDDLLAFEYVIGTAEDRDHIARRISDDPAFATAVAEWEARLAGLNDEYAEVTPPALLPKIEARLFGRPTRRRMLWSFGGLVAASVAGLAVVPMWQTGPAVTRLTAPDQQLVVTAALDGDVLRMARVDGPEAPAGQSYEAWVILPGDAPVSVGLLRDGLSAAIPRPPEGTVIAISLEPEGGSPTGQPTGPVILSATLEI